ncbi:hypothetical protein [Sagittula sp. SSi028]|uniref:hypothetical protein n=1 Tax=Sagittula sp. SSi028 TaxID=3400636 RepID=UPI003AF8CBF0
MLKRLHNRPSPDNLAEAALPGPSKHERLQPLLYGAGLLAVGTLLIKLKPRFGVAPNPIVHSARTQSKRRKAAAFARDRAAGLAPGNVTDKLGKSLVLGGVAMMTARLLDEALARKS